MTDDLDRRAALLMGKWCPVVNQRTCSYATKHGHQVLLVPFAPTSNPVDTRALVQAVTQGTRLSVNTVVNGEWAQAWVQRTVSSDSIADALANPSDDGPNYDLLAVTHFLNESRAVLARIRGEATNG